jgi:hypothetical protein
MFSEKSHKCKCYSLKVTNQTVHYYNHKSLFSLYQFIPVYIPSSYALKVHFNDSLLSQFPLPKLPFMRTACTSGLSQYSICRSHAKFWYFSSRNRTIPLSTNINAGVPVSKEILFGRVSHRCVYSVLRSEYKTVESDTCFNPRCSSQTPDC